MKVENAESCVALCTLWTQTGNVRVQPGRCAVKGNLYSGAGINQMLRTLLANPNIRYLILCGNDRTGSGSDLVNLFQKGVESSGQIAGSKTVIESALRGFIGDVRRNVELIDMRGSEDAVESRIDSLKSRPPWSKPVIVRESRESPPGMNVKDVSGFRIEGDDISDAWLRIIDTVMKFGEDKKSEHDVPQKEVLNIMATVGEEGDIEEWLPFGRDDMEKYYETFFGTGSDKGLSYTYGKRLFRYIMSGSEEKWEQEAQATFNQVENALEHLRRAPHTRRAAAFTWHVREDSMSSSPPCLTQITWNIKYGKLFQTAVFRSHDMFGGWPMNAFALRELQKRMASDLEISPGTMTIISNSAHIYENNFRQARETISRYFTGKKRPFREDKLGYFTIGIAGGEIEVRHVLPDHTKTEFAFRGRKAEDIYRMLIHEGLVSRHEHAAYIGKELARAEEALKSGKEYIQQ